MLRKLDVEQNKVLFEEEKTELATVAADKVVRYDFRIQKETNRWHRIQHEQRKEQFRKS